MTQKANPMGVDPTNGGEPISQAEAQLLIQTYRDSGGWGKGQTRSVWFSKDNFIQILNMITEFEGDGMDIYLGKYPADASPVNYQNRITLVFVPTVDKKDIFDVEGSSSNAALAADDDGDGGDEDAFDHGELKP